jgi:phosphoglycerol transferase
VTSAVLAAILLVAVLDETSGADVPPYRANAVEYDSDEAFVGVIEHRLPAGAMVFQLPVVAFPESPRPARMKDYDHFVGYLHSRNLRWSYGGMKGREADWQDTLAGQPTELLLARLAAVGFTGLTVDRFGYADNASILEADLSRIAGPPAVSRNGRLSFFDLTAYRDGFLRDRSQASVRDLAGATLRPVRWESGPGFDSSRADGASFWLTASAGTASLIIHNPGSAARSVVFQATLESGGTGHVTVTPPAGTTESDTVRCGRAPLRREFSAPPGVSELRFSADVPPVPAEDGPTDGEARFRLLRPSLWEAAPAAGAGGPPGPAPPC